MTLPLGGAVSGRGQRYFPIPSNTAAQFGLGSLAFTAPNLNELELLPVWNPYAIKLSLLGSSIAVAGSADSTFQPAIYTCNADGSPGPLLVAGTIMPGNAGGSALGAVNVTLPANSWLWMGALVKGTTAPQLLMITDPVESPFGGLIRLANGSLFSRNYNQTGLAAIPNPYGGVIASGASIALQGVAT